MRDLSISTPILYHRKSCTKRFSTINHANGDKLHGSLLLKYVCNFSPQHKMDSKTPLFNRPSIEISLADTSICHVKDLE